MLSIPLIWFAVTGSLFLDFEGSDIEDHLEKKKIYYSQFSEAEKYDFCKSGDVLSCKILFLESFEETDDKKYDQFEIINYIPQEKRAAGIYHFISEKWRDLSVSQLKEYLSMLPENYSKRLFNLYLKKLYLSGNINEFVENYKQSRSTELTTWYVRELLKKGPDKALSYLLDLKVVFPEYFYDSIAKEIEKYSKKLKGRAVYDFRIWKLEFNYRKVRYSQTINLANGWFPAKKYANSHHFRAHLYRAMSYTKKRKHPRAIAIYKRLEKYIDNEKLSGGDRYKFYQGYGYSSSAVGDNEKAIETYFKAHEHFHTKDDESASFFLYNIADMLRLDGQLEKADAMYAAYVENYPDAGKIDVAKFLLFWINYLKKDLKRAGEILDGIIKGAPQKSYIYQRAMYWKARVLQKQGDDKNSMDIFCDLSKRYPASLYGSFAAGRVRKSQVCCGDPASLDSDEKSVDRSRFKDNEMLSETEWIVAAVATKDDSIVKKLIRASSSVISYKGGEIDRLVVSYCAGKTGNHNLAAKMLKSISNFSGNTREYFKMKYTIGFEEEIVSHCDFYGISPFFVFSIARQESLFNVGAVSSSYAIGLLQLLPSTAQLLANSEGYGKVTTANLKKPLTNVRFGIKYLANLLKRFDNSIALAAGGYNAGPGRISKWLAQKPDMELDEFIEDIPIFQTRNYVKKVMRNYAIYYYIYEGEAYDGMSFD